MSKIIFVSGCYDLLHSGHVAFFNEAAQYGDLYVGLGSDQTVFDLKGRKPVNTEQERLYMVNSLKCVKKAWINRGNGVLDFREDLIDIKPDILFVNEDGHSYEKEKLCKELGIEYIISKRIPHAGLPQRSTTELREICNIPYRIDLAGGWLDQPYVSKFYPGPVITISIEPDYQFNDRSGMSTSTRKKAMELWQTEIPKGDNEKLALILFCCENAPGRDYVSGSQDALGIVLPGINYLDYKQDEYWPHKIVSNTDESTLKWLEERIYLMALNPRHTALMVTDNADITEQKAKALSIAANNLWKYAKNKDKNGFGKSMIQSYEAQIAMFPNMVTEEVTHVIEQLPNSVIGYKLSGAGGGGYLVLFSEKEIPNTLKIRIRRAQ